MGDPVSYMFNEEAKQGKSFVEGADCCLTNPTASTGPVGYLTLAPSQGTFWNTFTDNGEVDFNGVHYQGKVKYYTMTQQGIGPPDFWYFTDLDGVPVQQGEAGKGPTDQGYPATRGHTIWHDYDQSSFITDPIDESIFAIPEICQSTSK